MVAAILDSGAIQHQRAELQKDLAIDFGKEALAIWSKNETSESTLEHRQGTAFLQYLAGTATIEQVCLGFNQCHISGLTFVCPGRTRYTVHQESAIALTAATGAYSYPHPGIKIG